MLMHLVLIAGSVFSQVGDSPKAPPPQPVPAMQVLPLPMQQAAVEWNGREISRYYFGADNRRTFLYPLIGPSGKSLVRMGHPRDPNGHSHHNGLWISHHDVNGVGFWNDSTSSKGRIVHKRVSRYEDTNAEALIEVENSWIDDAATKIMEETRAMRFIPQKNGEWLLVIDLLLAPGAGAKEGVTFGKTPFGITGIRMAKTIGVHDGGGRVLNSEGGVNEAGVFWKPAKWVDYSGPIMHDDKSDAGTGGVTLFDHPINPSHPSHFHVRDDGWMGACLSYEAPRKIAVGETLKLRYGFWIHSGVPQQAAIEDQFAVFAKIGDPPAKTKP